jgi:D-alanyl-D-alanine-carboxypeptidase/D-alanyl-D-alanine-endopeptidase
MHKTIFRPMKILSFIIGFGSSLILSTGLQAKPTAYVDVSPITADMQQILSLYSLDGASLQLMRNGSTVYNEYQGSFSANTRVPIASASKWLSALALARVVEKDQMSWEDTVGQYIANAPADKKNIRLRQLFSHTSGINATENSCMSNPAFTLGTCTAQILAMPLNYAPGTTFAYGGNSMQVAGRMAEIATGKSWDQIFIDEMVIPLGLTSTDYATGSSAPGYVRNSNPRVPGGIRSTARDYCVVLAMLQNEGLHQGARFLSSATLDYMATNHAAGLAIGYTPYPESFGYGLGQWREAEDFSGIAVRVSSPGAFGTTPWVDKRNRIAGIFFVKNQWSALRKEIFDLQDLVNTVYSTRYRIPPPQRPKPANIPTYKQEGNRR